MPRINWGVRATDVDNFDRDSQYTPYIGPIPVNGVYRFTIKKLQHVAGTREKNPQLRVGLELKPRNADEKRYSGYFIMAFIPVTDRTQFRYVPFLDALGVKGRDFERNTITDEEGNIKKIGGWRNTGSETILAELKDGVDDKGNSRKEVGWMGNGEDLPEDDDLDDDENYDGDEEDDDDGWDE